METKANYLLIGAFTLAGLLGSLVFLVWLAKVEVERQYAYYDVLFDNVLGLGAASDVRYNGLPVGRVVDLRLDTDDPARVRVRIEVDAATPLKTDTVATLQSQGVTGVSFVALSGGSASAGILPQNETIVASPSPLQSVLEGAPVLLQSAVDLLENIKEVVNPENREAIGTVLNNLASASGRLDRTLEDFEGLSANLGAAAEEVAGFADRLEGLADTADVTLQTATETLSEARTAIQRGTVVLDTADAALQSADSAFVSAQTLMEKDITPLVRQGTAAAARIDQTLTSLEAPARQALESAETALAEAETTFAAANRVLDDDIDGMIGDLRGAVTAFRDTLAIASTQIEAISGQVLTAADSAATFTATLENVVTANERQLNNFLGLGLPELLRLTEEARKMVGNLDRFIDRIDRDPARYFLGTQGSEFRR